MKRLQPILCVGVFAVTVAAAGLVAPASATVIYQSDLASAWGRAYLKEVRWMVSVL